ncbi:hypothetical protein WN943_020301 [Citrus x changshan-huyou]
MMLAQTLPPLPFQPATFGKRSCSIHPHDEETIKKKKLKTTSLTYTGCGTDVVDRAAMLKLRFADIISKAQNRVHDREDEETAARRKKIRIEAQRKAARLELENMEKNAILEAEDNCLAIKQLEDLAGCSFGFMIDPKISEDGDDDDSKVTMCVFRGGQHWNPLEKIIGLTIKGHQDKREREILVMKKLQENPQHHHEREEKYKAHSTTGTRRLLQLQSQRQAARLELHKIENSADIQDNLKSFRQLQELAGCSLSFMIDPSLDDDDAAKVMMGAFQGTRFWNPLEKIGLRLKD